MGKRAAGLLFHPTSLPGRAGIGDLGPAASAFLQWMAAAGQSVWQFLPLGPPSGYNSPYGCLSAFAGNPLLISPAELLEDGFLPASALARWPELPHDHVDFANLAPWKEALLHRSWRHFQRHATPLARMELEAFLDEPGQAGWLADWTLFSALKERFKGSGWLAWDRDLKLRDPQALSAAREELAEPIAYHGFLQFLFFRQWERIKAEAHRQRIRLFGDIPIYVALDSADVWAHQDLFALDGEGNPELVAGVPPDYFSATGQLWGNPVFRWERMAEDGFAWWIQRIAAALRVADMVRIDHFRGFAGYWEVPASEATAINGRWVPGPGRRLFDAIRGSLGEVAIVAEDLGLITPDVVELRRGLSFPGMKVMQFAFSEIDSEHLPHRWEPNMVGYTGTHDNDTTRGWFRKASTDEQRRVLDYAGATPETVVWGMIRTLYTSVADLVVVPMQDVFDLDSEARMNTPAKAGGNWAWRATREQFGGEPALRLRRLAELTGRLPQ
jgi:4-alpha-glucanotransferase